MDFTDGDQVVGQYGNTWTRKDGRWFLQDARDSCGDTTIEWLLALDVPTAKVAPHDSGKLSKSRIVSVLGYIIKYRLKATAEQVPTGRIPND